MDSISFEPKLPHTLSDFTALLETHQKFEESPYETFELFSRASETLERNPFSLHLDVFKLILDKVTLSFETFKEEMSAESTKFFSRNIDAFNRIYKFRSLQGSSLPPLSAYIALHEAETIFTGHLVPSKTLLGSSIKSAKDTYLTFIREEARSLANRLQSLKSSYPKVSKSPNAKGASKTAAKSQTTALSTLTPQRSSPKKGKSPLSKVGLNFEGL